MRLSASLLVRVVLSTKALTSFAFASTRSTVILLIMFVRLATVSLSVTVAFIRFSIDVTVS